MVQIYVRIGKGRNGYKTAAGMKSNPSTLSEVRDGTTVPIPTVEVCLNIDLAETAFNAAIVNVPIEDDELKAAILDAGVA